MADQLAYLKKEADRLKQIKGNVKGEVFKNHLTYITYKEGQAAGQKIEDTMAKIGWPVDFAAINPYALYPESQSVMVILAAKTVFNWSEKDIHNMGYAAPQSSFFVKIIIHYLISVDRLIKEAPKSWGKHYDFGELKIMKLDKEKKYCSARISGYNFHPLLCIYFQGYFLRMLEYLINNKNITIRETKCVHQGSPYHEFEACWHLDNKNGK